MIPERMHEPSANAKQQAAPTRLALDPALGLAGAVAGGIAGYYIFLWAIRQGFYAVMFPGVCVGWGCGRLSGRRSVPLAVACGILGLAAGICSEWQAFPFVADASLSYFLAHLHELSGVTQVLILLGAACGAWFGLGQEGGTWPRVRPATGGRSEDGG